MQGTFETEIKIIIVGNGRVGKTCLINRFANGFYLSTYKKTLGADFLEKRSYVESVGSEVTFFLWDTAGQEEYDCITRAYYRGAGCAIVAFSLVDLDSFRAVSTWVSKVREECGYIPVVLVQTKTDLQNDAVVSARDTDELANELGLDLFRICSKNNVNVDKVFEHLSVEYLRFAHRNQSSSNTALQNISLSSPKRLTRSTCT